MGLLKLPFLISSNSRITSNFTLLLHIHKSLIDPVMSSVSVFPPDPNKTYSYIYSFTVYCFVTCYHKTEWFRPKFTISQCLRVRQSGHGQAGSFGSGACTCHSQVFPWGSNDPRAQVIQVVLVGFSSLARGCLWLAKF